VINTSIKFDYKYLNDIYNYGMNFEIILKSTEKDFYELNGS